MNCMDDTGMNLFFSPRVRMGSITIRLPSTFEINHSMILFRKQSIFILCICDEVLFRWRKKLMLMQYNVGI